MKRREFLKCSGSGAGAATPSLDGSADARQAMQQQTLLSAKPDSPKQAQPARLRYEFEVDIVERIESAGSDSGAAISRGTGQGTPRKWSANPGSSRRARRCLPSFLSN